ncbi:MAG TPA: ABC transporter ATP-binding protein, partial [Cytophagales bacterium]|nr:ABC transporter ATP-binding protein [Cytophagales bacterium]
VRELVALGRFPHTGWSGKLGDADLKKVEEAIAACRIEYLANSRVFEISDGQRQKAMIARALAQDGPVMLLDEPTAHLDLPNKGEIMHLLHGLARDLGKAILVSTHDLQLALQMADRLMLADCVEPLETGAPEDLMLTGRVARLFDHPQFMLDARTGQYRIRREEGEPIAVEGPETALHWLTVALEKHGYLVQAEANRRIVVREAAGFSFLLGDREFSTIAALLSYLEATQ